MKSQYNESHERVKQYIATNKIQAEFLLFPNGVHTVEDACHEAKISPNEIAKSIVMIDSLDRLVVGIVLGGQRASTKRIGKLLEIDIPRAATPKEVLHRISYPVGGVPCFGYEG